MTLLLHHNKDLYHFRSIDDAELWLTSNGIYKEDVIIMCEDEYNEEFQKFLDFHAPILIEQK